MGEDTEILINKLLKSILVVWSKEYFIVISEERVGF
jgi:hypothetical protein